MEISRQKEVIFVTLLVLVTAVLRFMWLGTVEFKVDEANLFKMSLDFVNGHGFPVRGISSSTGFPNAPMSVWLYAIPLFIWPHIYSATIFTALLNVFAVVGCYWLVRRIWGVEAALISALMFAVSPWMLHHSRKIWAQNLLPPFTVAWGLSAVYAFLDNKPKWLLWHCLALAIVVQVHFAGAPLFLISLALVIVYRKRLNWTWLFAGCVAGFLTFLPFGLHLLQTGALSSLGSGGEEEAATVSLNALQHLFTLGTGAGIQGLVGATAYPILKSKVFGFLALPPIWNVLILAGILWLIWQARTENVARFMLAWLIIPVIAFSYSSVPVVLHYVFPSYPVPFIAVGGMLAMGLKKFRWLWLPFGATLIMQAWLWVGVLDVVGNTFTPEGHGVPQGMMLSAVNATIDLYEETGATEIILAGNGAKVGQDQFATTYSVLLDDYPTRTIDLNTMSLFPKETAVILMEKPNNAVGLLDYADNAARHSFLPQRESEPHLALSSLDGTQPHPNKQIEPIPVLENWASIANFDSSGRLFWNTGDAIAGNYQLFVHFFQDGDEQRVGQFDTSLFDSAQWRSGDRVINYVPTDGLEYDSVNIGMYTYPDLAPVRVFDVAGNLTADFITIDLE